MGEAKAKANEADVVQAKARADEVILEVKTANPCGIIPVTA